jgi:hypothetical protein
MQSVELMLIALTLGQPLFLPQQPMQSVELMLIALALGQLLFLPQQPLQSLELMTGIEPVTSPLPRECSTN